MSNIHEYLVTIYGLKDVSSQYGAFVTTKMKSEGAGPNTTDSFHPVYSTDTLARKLSQILTHPRDVKKWGTLPEPSTLEGRAITPVSNNEIEEIKKAYLVAYEDQVTRPGSQAPGGLI